MDRHPFAKVRFADFDPLFRRDAKILDLGDNHWSYMVCGAQIKRLHVKYNYTVSWLERAVKVNLHLLNK